MYKGKARYPIAERRQQIKRGAEAETEPLGASLEDPQPLDSLEPAGGDATVSLKTTGRGTVQCAGGNVSFDGDATVFVEAYQLPATCLITIDGKRGVFQVYSSGTVTCNIAGAEVGCDPMVVN